MSKRNGKGQLRLILGSSSPRRSEILRKAGYKPEVISPNISEKSVTSDQTSLRTRLIARKKCKVLAPSLEGESGILVCCDTAVFYNGELREKPEHHTELVHWITGYGKNPLTPAIVVSSIAMLNLATGKIEEGTEEAKVFFNPYDAPYIIKHITKGKTFLDRAGGFDIGHELWTQRIREVKGNPDCVRGMPMTLFHELLEKLT